MIIQKNKLQTLLLKYFIFSLVLFHLGSCSMEEDILLLPQTEDLEEITFVLDVCDHRIPVTRADIANDERIETVDLLFFSLDGQKARKFKKHEKGTNLTTVDNKLSLKVKFSPEDANTEIVFIINARESIFQFDITDTKEKVLQRLTKTMQDKWDLKVIGLPMYGEFILNEKDIVRDNYIVGIELERMLARIDVKVLSDDLILENVYLCNRNTVGYIAPNWDTKGNIKELYKNGPNCPDNPGKDIVNVLSYPVTENELIGEIYTFESEGATDEWEEDRINAVCLVIQGKYQGETNYYRIDFTHSKANNEAGIKEGDYMPLLRNHQYVVDIVEVLGIGYKSFQEAIGSYTLPSNARTRIFEISSRDIKKIVYNGQLMLGVTEEEVVFGKNETNAKTISVYTNYSKGWVIDSSSDWLQCEVNDNDLQETLGVLNIKPSNVNNTGKVRQGYITIKAGRLLQTLYITQSI